MVLGDGVKGPKKWTLGTESRVLFPKKISNRVNYWYVYCIIIMTKNF